MKKVAIWGNNRYSNYGDDLQTLVFALHVRNIGLEPIVFQLEKEIAKKFNLQVANNLDELFKDVNLCIIAGGALLTPFRFLKRNIIKAAIEYEADFRDLNKAIKKYPNVKVCAISIGGDGEDREPAKYYSRHRISFFSSPQFLDGTVRLEGDIAQMKKFGKNFKFIPDCLLSVNKFTRPLANENSIASDKPVTRIGFNFKKGKYLSKPFIDELLSYADKNKHIIFYFITTHLDKTGIDYEYTPPNETQNIKIIKYGDPEDLLHFMAQLDVLISSKLHLGITALTLQTPFLSYRGPGKAKSFLRSVGGGEMILDDEVTFEKLNTTFFQKSKKELFNMIDTKLFDSMMEKSFEQFKFAEKVIEKYA